MSNLFKKAGDLDQDRRHAREQEAHLQALVERKVQETMQKVSAAQQQQRSYQESISQLREKRSQDRMRRTMELMAKYSQANMMVECYRSNVPYDGKPVTQQDAARLQKLSQEIAQEIAGVVAEGGAARDELAELLVEAAAQSPEAAAQLITAETGQNVTPQQVDNMTDDMAEVAIQSDEASEGSSEGGSSTEDSSKEESAKKESRANLVKRSHVLQNQLRSLPPQSAQVLQLMALRKVSHVQHLVQRGLVE